MNRQHARLLLALAAAVFGTQSNAAAEVLYVASNHVLVIDSESGERLAEIGLERFVHDMVFAADGSRAYLAVSDGVVEVDAQNHVVLGHLTETPAFKLALSEDGGRLFILGNEVELLADQSPRLQPSTVQVYDLVERRVVATHSAGERAEDLLVDDGEVRVLRPFEYTIEALNAAGDVSHTIVFEEPDIPGASGFLRGMSWGTDRSRYFVGQAGPAISVHAVDPTTGVSQPVASLPEGFVTGVAATQSGEVLVSTRNDLYAVDVETGAERGHVALGGAHFGMALGEAGVSYHTMALVEGSDSGVVTVVDLATLEVERVIPTPGMSPAAIAVVPHMR